MSGENSERILKKLLKRFKISDDMPNREYLEARLEHLTRMSATYRIQSKSPELSARARAKARDMEQNCEGLIHGIKFGISFWLHKDSDLEEMDRRAKEDG
jgi:hypothetical protein